jgi:thiamine-phosphate pyrophosphorylase
MAHRCLLYYITDRSQFTGNESARHGSLLAKIAEAAGAGVEYIQLREKDLTSRKLEMLAREVLAVMRDETPPGTQQPAITTRLLINSRTDVALAVGAHGVHLRSDDVAAHEVRRMLDVAPRPTTTERFLIAASCHNAAELCGAESGKIDFAVFAPVFEKRDAPGIPPTGLTALHEACQTDIPVFALGGVTLENAASCLKMGAAGIAGIRLFQENNIGDVARALRAL